MGYALCRRPPRHCSLLWDCSLLALLQADIGIFGTQTCHLARLIASFWRPGGPWGDIGTLGSMTKDTLMSRLGFLSIFGGYRFLGPRKVFLFMLVCSLLFLMTFSLDLDVWDCKTIAFGQGSIAKINFQRSWNSNDFMNIFV